MQEKSEALREVSVLRARPRRHQGEELVVVEEPLVIRLDGDTLAVTMRTPGHDRELVLGFLCSEGVIRSARDVGSIAPCALRPGEPSRGAINVVLAPGVRPPIDEHGELARRGTLISSACGVCGRRSLDEWLATFAPLAEDRAALDVARVVQAMHSLRTRQPLFAASGGCHAASLLDANGEVVFTYEDIGRHNAVDKVVGAALRHGPWPLEGHTLLVSGRASFEIVQKALAARIETVASVSAPSSLAIELATRGNVTLLGFVRDDRATVYAGAERIR